MKKITIVRFKPKPECNNEFIKALKEQGKSVYHDEHYIMQCDDEVVAIAIRDSENIEESARQGVNWLDQQRHLLQEYNAEDRHTIFMTGELIDN